MIDPEVVEASDAARELLPHRYGRAAIGATILGTLLLASMLFRGVIAAQDPPRDASTTAQVASNAESQPHAPAEEAGRSNPDRTR